MSETEKSIVKKNGRILYVEPNDVHGTINGVPLTPDYSDYCISVNLIAEVVPRVKQSGGETSSIFTASWTQRPQKDENGNEITPNNWVAFLQGEDATLYAGGETNFLTTYYTDINYDDIVRDNIVEGLGIESVQVSFESYYTPTIVIKFVDVRGASLFGREEVVHNSDSYSANLAESSVFGVFFTIPYPKFKLQIKGFYGKAVTYQLTCSDFKASFNSQTGNFEAIATFIGYSYSLLTDIPLRYLIAAPCCDYVGFDYWQSHANSENWALDDGKAPRKLIDIFEDINSLIIDRDQLTDTIMTDDETNTKSSLNSEKELLTGISTCLGSLLNSLRSMTDNKYIYLSSSNAEDNYEQLVLFNGSESLDIPGEVRIKSDEFWDAFNKYDTSFPDKALGKKFLPNGFSGSVFSGEKLAFSKFCTINKDNNGRIKNITFNCNEQSPDGIMSIKNSTRTLFEQLAKVIWKDSRPENGSIKTYFENYFYILNLNKLKGEISRRLRNINKLDKEIDKKIKLKIQEIAKEKLHFTPYIGNIFKIIMCHLETFIHMLWECYRVIDDDGSHGRRTPDYLGVDPSQTDFPPNIDLEKGLGAWVGLFNHGSKTEQGGDIDTASEVIAWVGDFSHNFEEEKLVRALYKAIKNVQEKFTSSSEPISTIPSLPVTPNDINNMSNIFDKSVKNDISALAGYLSFRAANAFGIFLSDDISVELANTLGRMDAYNYYGYINSKSDIKNYLLERQTDNSLDDILYNISLCNSNGDKYCTKTYENNGKSRHTFETAFAIDNEYNKQNRHPMFKEDGDKLTYVHYYLKNKSGIIPDVMMKYENYATLFDTVGSADNTYFKLIPKEDEKDTIWDANGFLHKASSKSIFKPVNGYNEGDMCQERYVNNEMFDIQTNTFFTDGVKSKFEQLKNGTFEINGDEYSEDFTTILDKTWHVSSSYYGWYYSGCEFVLSKRVEELDMTEDELYPDIKDTNDSSKAPKTLENLKWLEEKDTYIKFDIEKDEWVDNENNVMALDNLFIRYFRSCFKKSNGNYEWQNLFADPFYYLQNDKKPFNQGLQNEESKSDMEYRQKCVKGLLFLHTLDYNYNKIAEFFNDNKKNGGIYSLPYGYVLLLGGLLWREKYIEDSGGFDPIQSGCGYAEVGGGYTLFVDDNHKFKMCAFMNSENFRNHVKVSTLFGGEEHWKPDNMVVNKLINVFIDFIDGTWSRIINDLELWDRYSDNQETRYNCNRFKDEAKKFKKTLNNFIQKPSDKPMKLEEKGVTITSQPTPAALMVWVMTHRQKIFNDIFGKYKFIYVEGGNRNDDAALGDARGILLLLDENNKDLQDTLKSIYTKQVIVTDSSRMRYYYNEESSDNEITISSDLFKSYLKGFSTKISEIAENERATPKDEFTDYDDNFRRDLLITIYLYLKTLWDRWLVATTNKKVEGGTIPYTEYYNVENFFNSFSFIDAYYRNIKDKFLINLETLKNVYGGMDENATLFQFMGNILDRHRCLFLALPDYIDMGNPDSSKAVSEMKDIFRPIPYIDMNEVANENRFVIIYQPRMSEVPMSTNKFKEDYFKIWNPDAEGEDKWDANIPKVFTYEPVNENNIESITRYGYYVPSFGVAFSKQENHLFKNISLNMSSPLVTSASAATIANIAQQGSGANHQVAFIGQDLYPVFSNYSYICEVEMMGDAQVQPLMYFQLMNIPMWSGVYMIFNVSHNIVAGNMTTRFKGFKLARRTVPFSDSWFLYTPEPDNYGDENDGEGFDRGEDSSPNSNSGETEPPVTINDGSGYHGSTGKIENHYDDEDNYLPIKNTWRTRETCANGTPVSEKVKSIYNRLYEEIKEYQERNGGKMTWNIGITSVGHGGHTKKSQHYRGYAIDLQLTRFDEQGNCKGLVGGKGKTPDKNYFTVMDMIFSLHFNEVHQVIYEVYSKDQYYNDAKQYQPKCLHIGVKEKETDNTMFYCDDGQYHIWSFDSNVKLPEFKGIAAKYYKLHKGNFRSVFPNFGKMSDEELDKLFKESIGEIGGTNMLLLKPIILDVEGGYVEDSDGCTMKGINITTYKKYCSDKGLPVPSCQDLKNIPDTHWNEIFSRYWNYCKADKYKSQSVANIIVDWYFNSGSKGIKSLQEKVLGCKNSGVVGDETLNKILNWKDQHDLFNKIYSARESYFKSIATGSNAKYLNGWIKRLKHFTWVG